MHNYKILIFTLLLQIIFWPVVSAQQKPADSAFIAGKDHLILFDSTRVIVEPTGLSHVTQHLRIRVLSAQGAKKLAVYKVGYDPLSAWVEITSATIYRAGRYQEQLDTSSVLDYPAPARAIYWGAREKMLPVGRLEPGDEFEITTYRKGFTYALLQYETGNDDDEKYIPPMKGHFYDIVPFWSDQPVMEKVYSVSIPAGKQVQYEVYNGELKVSVKPDGENMVYTFSRKKFSKPAREPNMVAESDVFPKLLISTSPDWQAKSKWFYNVNESFGSFESTPEIDRKVAEILEGAEDELDSVARLTHWVADNIRYSGIPMGPGEGYTLHKGSMTFHDRCGVCKDKAGMLITMLRAAGFEAYAAMTMAGSRIDRIPADQFNHSVAVVRLSDGELHLLDPTWVPFVRELWSSLEQQQQYLMGLPDGADLATTPISPPENHPLKIVSSSEINDQGTLQAHFTIEADGQSDAAIRRLFTGSHIASWEKSLRNEILSVFPNAVISGLSWSNPYNYQEEPMKISFTISVENYALVTDEEILFTPPAAKPLFKRAQSHLNLDTSVEVRKYPFRDRCSRKVMISDEIKLPGRTELHYLPATELLSGTGASFKGAFYHEPAQITFEEIIRMKKRIYQPEDWGSVKSAVLSEKKLYNEPVILRFTPF
ncbi:MAG: DUF3857 and transglutaminase domain-containing protein [Bacteroidales bacterium]